jgi:GT2 family glycosyltransferase
MWIDSDINFKTTDFFKLLSSDKEIISGLYHLQPPGGRFTQSYVPVTYACYKNSREMLYTSDNDLNSNQPIEVYANGMGWMLVKKEVFEDTENPFDQTYSEQSEDIIFQVKAREKGYKSYIIPDVILGHEKMLIVK